MPGPALARNLVAGRDVDHIEREIGELGAEGRGEIVAAALDENEIEIGKAAVHLGDRGEIDRGVLADRRMRAAAGLDADDALGRERAGARQEFGVLFRVDVIGDGGEVDSCRAALLQSRSISAVLPEPTGPPTPTRKGPWGERGAIIGVVPRFARNDSGPTFESHERNSLVYCVS